ncbi:MAG: hypothetical protein JF616_16100 [Fibrobacteres bacterium]|nr:hypothetical protein [Fibrobacterota bacterium]
MTGFPSSAACWLWLYRSAWILALPGIRLLARARLLPRNWRVTERLSTDSPWPASMRPLWMHCASLGEAKGLWTLARALPPDFPVLLTAATAEGIDYLALQCAGSEASRRTRLAPFDHPGLIDAFLERGGIRGLCLYEAELWPNALAACARRGLPVALAAGRLTPEALRVYRRFGGAALRLLDGMAWIDAQSEGDRSRFAQAVSAPVVSGGDYKALAFLSGAPSREGPRSGFAFVSLHLEELRLLLPVLPALQARSGIVVFPRRPGEFEGFDKALGPMGFARASDNPDARHLWVDGFGQVLARLPHCHTAFVGGSLIPHGCHNLWEPLAAGCRILFGPHYSHQRSIADLLLARDLAQVVAEPATLAAWPEPDAGQPVACAAFARELENALGASLQACRERIIATFFPIAPAPPAGRQAGLAAPAGKGNKR